MTLSDLISQLKTIADSQVGVGSFVFNNLSFIDTGDSNDYPLIFVQPPNGAIANINSPEETFNMEVWVFDLYLENDSLELAEKWSSVHTLGTHFMRQARETLTPDVKISPAINIERGHMMHNDSLIGVKYTFDATIFTDCTVGDFTNC